jgi:hypothetical protein
MEIGHIPSLRHSEKPIIHTSLSSVDDATRSTVFFGKMMEKASWEVKKQKIGW